MRTAYLLLLPLTMGIAAFDLKHRRIPNRVSHLLLAAGLALHLPGSAEIWFGSAALFLGWKMGAIGAGDTKLWTALLWLAPPLAGPDSVIVFGIAWLASGLAQIVFRRLRGLQILRVRSPGAWRVLPFALWLAMTA